MSISYKKNVAALGDVVAVEEAEELLQWLHAHPKGKIDLRQCQHLHAANVQVLMAARRPVLGWPDDPTLRAWLHDALTTRAEGP